jgi:predicted small metal-binding protein
MDKKLSCRDIGLDCEYVVCARTEEEVIRKVGEHTQAIHGLQGFSKEFYNRALGAIRDAHCEIKKTSCEDETCEEIYHDISEECYC